MHKNGKWAQQILGWQREDGSWGDFHSLAVAGNSHVTTEQALRRLERLGYTLEDPCIRKAVRYLDDCLAGRCTIPDRVEKVQDWRVFTALMFSTALRRFTAESTNANRIAAQWAEIVTAAFAGGALDPDAYLTAYKRVLQPNGGRVIGIENYYPVSLLRGCLDPETERAFVRHLLYRENGIYYIADGPLSVPPQNFRSREASRYLAAIEMLAQYPSALDELQFVADWLHANRTADGRWDMGRTVNDKTYFPLSDDWRKAENRIADCTERIENLLRLLQN